MCGKNWVALRHRGEVVIAGGRDVGERHEPAGEHLRVGRKSMEETRGRVKAIRVQSGRECEREPVVHESGFSGEESFHLHLQATALRWWLILALSGIGKMRFGLRILYDSDCISSREATVSFKEVTLRSGAWWRSGLTYSVNDGVRYALVT